WGIGESMFMYFQPIYLQQWGANPQTIGLVYGAWGLSIMITQIPAGILTDRIGARPIIRLSWTLGIFACLLMALSGSLEVFIVGIVFYGFTAFGVTPMNSYITQVKGNLTSERALTFASGGFNLGAVIGPFLGGIIAQQSGIRTIFFIVTGIFMISTIFVFFTQKQSIAVDLEHLVRPKLHKNPRFMVLLPLVLISMFALYMPQPLIPNYLQNQKYLELSSIGQMGSIGNLGNAILILSLGRFNAVYGYLLGQALVVLSMVLLWKGNHPFWYGAGYFLLGGYRLTRVMLVAFARSLIHAADVGRAFGYLETVNGIAIILAPVLAGYLYDINPEMLFSSSVFLVLGILILNVFFMLSHWKKSSQTK
ncbi:MAG: MFS transporter, partial [Anaerolineaceae bacterium]|nr:MFS transporter [Anaerolineaceae bacterium]